MRNITPGIMVFKKYKSVRTGIHILVWVLYFSLTLLPGMINDSIEKAAYFTLHFIILISTVYINIGWLIKKYFYKERYKQYLLMVLLLWLLGIVAVYASGGLLSYAGTKLLKYNFGAIIAFTMEFFLFSMYKVAKEWYIKSLKSKEIEFEKMQAELTLLRSQLDSHFIFNTLNNLYLLVINKSDKAPDAILKLSDLLSYIIYESHEEHVPLSKELDFIENYLSLQKLRLDNTQPVYFNIDGPVNGNIEPLILFNFIENIFKHADGLVTVYGQTYYAYITIAIDDTRLSFQAINGKKEEGEKNNTPAKHKGIGLENVYKRLDRVYENKYKLDITDTGQEYKVVLTIKEL